MTAFLAPRVRSLLVVLALALSVQHVEAARRTEPTAATATGTARPAARDDLDGWLILAGVVGVVILIAWLASRFGDNSSHVFN